MLLNTALSESRLKYVRPQFLSFNISPSVVSQTLIWVFIMIFLGIFLTSMAVFSCCLLFILGETFPKGHKTICCKSQLNASSCGYLYMCVYAIEIAFACFPYLSVNDRKTTVCKGLMQNWNFLPRSPSAIRECGASKLSGPWLLTASSVEVLVMSWAEPHDVCLHPLWWLCDEVIYMQAFASDFQPSSAGSCHKQKLLPIASNEKS